MTNNDFAMWTLMHKNIPVANLEIIEEVGTVARVVEVFNIHHAPVGTTSNERIDRVDLNNWLKRRSIPASRENLDQLMRDLNIINSQALSLKSLALSLSDQYWLKPQSEEIQWEDVNFFQNEFSEDVGKILVENDITNNPDMSSPDNTADGVLRKKWIIQGEKRILVKGGNTYTAQEPYNEVIATKIMEKLGIDHVSYTLGELRGKPYSYCENFITADTELITAWNIWNVREKIESESRYEHFLNCCEALEINDFTTAIDKMLVLDYIIANNDRHFGNFGFTRNADTLKYQGFAPIYDNGHSLWHREDDDLGDHLSKTFEYFHGKQINLIQDLSWYEPIPKQELAEIITKTLEQNNRITPEKIELITTGVIRNADFITELKYKLENLV